MKLLAALAFLSAIQPGLQAQTVPTKTPGVPFVTYYSPKDYGAAPQVFSFAQDDRGVLYIGHGTGLLEFDGTTFRTIRTPGSVIVRTMAKDRLGRIWVGTVGDFGVLTPNAEGAMEYFSLLTALPKELRDFEDIQSIFVADQTIYIGLRDLLVRLVLKKGNDFSDAGAMKKPEAWEVRNWRPKQRFGPFQFVRGEIYVREPDTGLMRLRNEKFELASADEAFTKHAGTLSDFARPGDDKEQELLVLTRDRGLYLYDEKGGVRKFPTDADDKLSSLSLARSAVLRDGTLAIALSNGGLLILGRDGKTRQYLDKPSGALPADGVLNVFVDRSGLLWLGMQKGFCSVEAPSPLSDLGETSGLNAFVNDIARHEGILYVASMRGVLYLNPLTNRFQEVAAERDLFNRESWGFLKVDGNLLAATSTGIYRITDREATRIFRTPTSASTVYALHRSRQNPKRLFLGLDTGIASILYDAPNRVVDEGRLVETPTIRSFAEPEPGVMWLGLESRGVARVRIPDDSLKNPTFERFGAENSIHQDGGISVHSAGGRLLFASKKGVFEFDEKTRKFSSSSLFNVVSVAGSPEEYSIVEDAEKNIWINLGHESAILRRQADGTYKADKTPVQRIATLGLTKIYPDSGGVVWFAHQEGIVRYDSKVEKNYDADFPVLIRKVSSGDGTMIYGGAKGRAEALQEGLTFDKRSLRFEYAAMAFEDTTSNEYQSKLEGFDSEWSHWSRETRRDYTNLPPGEFAFRVKARNLFGHESKEAVIAFKILPPWYRTWWAFAIYALALFALVFTIDRMQRRRVVARERERSKLLEAQLRARAAEAQAQSVTAKATALQAENERNKNAELLSEIGRELTSTLDFDTIFYRLYERVNQLMDASVFGVGLYHAQTQEIEYRLAVENGKRYAPYKRDTRDKNQFPVWCVENCKTVFINNVATEYSKYITSYAEQHKELEDGTVSKSPVSLMYLPLMIKNRVLGVITVQSFERDAYTDYHLNLLENLASYTSIALDNADAYRNLKAAQEQLVVQEKLASLGALTAGIAHEIKNPLNFVNNFADLSKDLMGELREEIEKHRNSIPADDYGNIEGLLDDLGKNASKVNEHGKRADSIVRSMLLHSRGQRGERLPTDVNALLEEYVNLSYHGMRAQDAGFNVTLERNYSQEIGKIPIVPQDMSRVFLNILNNACYAVRDKSKKQTNGYKPTVRVSTTLSGDCVEVKIRDNGMGIPDEVRDKIFNPFFTTKPSGQGTGLGLSISHDIVVQEHGGQLAVETEPGEFTEFTIRIPKEPRTGS
jgi:signal transduction histidine kinase/ligand-binding sensor domain-containing protein